MLLQAGFTAVVSAASSLSLDNDYRVRGVLIYNTNFNNNSSSGTYSYYSQRLNLTLTGKFNEESSDGIEVCTRISALGVAGSTASLSGITNSTNTVAAYPYPNTDFVPFINYAYVKINKLGDTPITVIAGQQPFNYGNGLIVADNGAGHMGFRVYGNYEIPIPNFMKRGNYSIPVKSEFFTARIAEAGGLHPGYGHDLYGLVNTINSGLFEYQISYFEDCDASGSPYFKGSNAFPTNSINKNFLDFYMTRKENISNIRVEIAKESGAATDTSGNQITLDGLGYVVYGELIGEKTKLGKVAAHAQIAYASGDSNPNTFDNDGSFNPGQTRRFDGLERVGYGELFAASPFDAFLPLPLNSYYSGIDTLNVGVDISPIYGWNLGVDYFYFAASQGPQGAPDASGFEKLYGANFSLGVEMDLYVKFTHSKYVESRFSYCRYTPPSFIVFWPTSDPATRYQFELSAKF
jgi:hypothetical protein